MLKRNFYIPDRKKVFIQDFNAFDKVPKKARARSALLYGHSVYDINVRHIQGIFLPLAILSPPPPSFRLREARAVLWIRFRDVYPDRGSRVKKIPNSEFRILDTDPHQRILVS